MEPAAVGLGTLLAGYRQAYERWMAGPRIDPDPDQAFFAIFEALNWAVAVDDRLKEAVPYWPRGFDQRDSLLGFRFARNAIHHDWADALWLDRSGAVLPTPLPHAFFEWCWRADLHSTKDWGRAKYRTHLSGKPVRFTLEALESLFEKGSAASKRSSA
jgi:hypothetical protein